MGAVDASFGHNADLYNIRGLFGPILWTNLYIFLLLVVPIRPLDGKGRVGLYLQVALLSSIYPDRDREERVMIVEGP